MIDMSEVARRLGKDCPTDIRLLTYVLEHSNGDNMFYGVTHKVAADLGMSCSSVIRGFTWLKDQGVVDNIQPGVWKVLMRPQGVIDTATYEPNEKDDALCVVVKNKS